MKSVREYLQGATKLKEKKDFEGACDYVKMALNKSMELKEPEPITTWLRLAMYLQKAGKNEDGWQLLVNLLENGHPQRSYFYQHDLFNQLCEIGEINAKMCLFLQREKKYDAALIYGVKSFLLSCKQIHLNAFIEKDEWLNKEFLKEWKDITKAETIENEISSYFKKTTKIEKLNTVASKIFNYLSSIDNTQFDIDRLFQEIKTELS